ncbi:MAG TPA: hypothetical protein VER11_02880 [Polyangiaceae bacterium]|nr:hypothetical protein [Polyangiaceae bacterium]
MTKRANHRDHPLPSVVALCLSLLQLVSTLHFALVPHGFGSDLSGLVHLRRALTTEQLGERANAATQLAPERPSLVAGSASCDPEACPLGFCGQLAGLLEAGAHRLLLWLPGCRELHLRANIVVTRRRVLLDAPKTSPPFAV